MGDLIIYGVPGAAVIVALVELLKRSGLPTRWAAPTAVGIGLVLAALLRLDDPSVGTWLQAELAGLLAGLSAAGLYSGTRAVRGS